MAIIYSLWGKNKTKEWPVVTYSDVYACKAHYILLEEHLKLNKEREENGEEKTTTIYDPSNNIGESYFVIKSMAFMTFEGFKAYNLISDDKIVASEKKGE